MHCRHVAVVLAALMSASVGCRYAQLYIGVVDPGVVVVCIATGLLLDDQKTAVFKWFAAARCFSGHVCQGLASGVARACMERSCNVRCVMLVGNCQPMVDSKKNDD